MKATYIVKMEVTQFMLDNLVGRFHTAFQQVVDEVLEENIKLQNKSAIGFKYNGTVHIHSSVKEQFKTAFALMELRQHPKIFALHPSLHEKMEATTKTQINQGIELARCKSFVSFCLSLAPTTTHIKLIFTYVELEREITQYAEIHGELFDAKDEVTELDSLTQSKLKIRMNDFQHFLDKLNVLKGILGL